MTSVNNPGWRSCAGWAWPVVCQAGPVDAVLARLEADWDWLVSVCWWEDRHVNLLYAGESPPAQRTSEPDDSVTKVESQAERSPNGSRQSMTSPAAPTFAVHTVEELDEL